MLTTIAIGAAAGLAGQLTRAVSGLYKARRADTPFRFDWVLFLSGAFLGMVAGAGCAMTTGVAGPKELTMAFGAGYIGVDFIEAGFKK